MRLSEAPACLSLIISSVVRSIGLPERLARAMMTSSDIFTESSISISFTVTVGSWVKLGAWALAARGSSSDRKRRRARMGSFNLLSI